MNLSKQETEALFASFNDMKALIIGDVMVDAYYWGKVDRISPEAPVPIVAVNKKEIRMGGAANVALNIQALGAEPILCSVIGDDEEGDEFIGLLEKNAQSSQGILRSASRRTTKKTRIIGNNHQMLRIDAEDIHPINEEESAAFLAKIKSILDSESISVIIFEDYDKGVLHPDLISQVVAMAKSQGIPSSVDPKKENFMAYQEVSLFKPNLKELVEGLKMDFDAKNADELAHAIQTLEQKLRNEITLLTLSESGVYINSSRGKNHIQAHHRDITDVSGAGDTVISVASLCLAAQQSDQVIAELSNLAGGLVCENVGVVPIVKQELLQEALALLAKP